MTHPLLLALDSKLKLYLRVVPVIFIAGRIANLMPKSDDLIAQ